MFSIAVLMMDTEISKLINKLNRNMLKIPTGGRLTSWLFTKHEGVELNLGPPNTNPSSGREEDLNL